MTRRRLGSTRSITRDGRILWVVWFSLGEGWDDDVWADWFW